MDMILFAIGFSFSFFFILLSYWKEDKQLHVIGTASLLILFIVLTGTSIQNTSFVLSSTQLINNVTGNFSINTYTPKVYTEGVFYENIGIGVMLVIFTALEYLYFALVYKFSSEGS